MDLKPYIESLRDQIAYNLKHDNSGIQDHLIGELDEFLSAPAKSDIEKAFFLILNQFPGSHNDYLIRPGEMVLVTDIYDMSVPGIEYEIDFAIYGGSVKDPVKVAIEVDGIRSHGHKQTRKDRRKDANLQAAGWLVMRFTSKEVHQEIIKFHNKEIFMSDFLTSIDNVIQERLQLVTGNNYVKYEVRSGLTGYKWGDVRCIHCGLKQYGNLSRKNHTCMHCKNKFVRDLEPHERIKYEHNGLYFFE
jgi:very-short-patch-repair endonuclease